MSAIWHDEGTWIALGVTLITVVVALAMHRVFVKILRSPPPDEHNQASQDEQ
jgi:NhaP-type Na+/H+ or K+/H+ antiporter